MAITIPDWMVLVLCVLVTIGAALSVVNNILEIKLRKLKGGQR